MLVCDLSHISTTQAILWRLPDRLFTMHFFELLSYMSHLHLPFDNTGDSDEMASTSDCPVLLDSVPM
jgi:hypothetical protein